MFSPAGTRSVIVASPIFLSSSLALGSSNSIKNGFPDPLCLYSHAESSSVLGKLEWGPDLRISNWIVIDNMRSCVYEWLVASHWSGIPLAPGKVDCGGGKTRKG